MLRSWLRRLALGAVLVAVAVAAVPVVTIVPMLRDDLALDRIVVAVALDWRDFDRDRAHQRLQYELDAQRIGSQIDEGDCRLADEPNEVRAVTCRWGVRVELPMVGRQMTLAFESVARIDRNGLLLR